MAGKTESTAENCPECQKNAFRQPVDGEWICFHCGYGEVRA